MQDRSERHISKPESGDPHSIRLRDRIEQAWVSWRYRILQRHRHQRPVLERKDGLDLLILPEVFHPSLFASTDLLASGIEAWSREVDASSKTVLDVGTGSGWLALVAARAGAHVIGTDINADASKCLATNAGLNRLDRRIRSLHGDLFEPVRGQRFDLVVFNPPYFNGRIARPWDHAWIDSTRVRERFASELLAYLEPGGCVLVVDSSRAVPGMSVHLESAGFETEVASTKRLSARETLVVYRAKPLTSVS